MITTAPAYEPAATVDEVGELLAHALADDLDRAFEQVVRSYQDRIIGVAGRMLGDAGRAEEVAQDVFVRAYRALQRYDRPRIRKLKLRPWLFSIAMNQIRNAARRRRAPAVALDFVDGHAAPLPDPSPSPAMLAEQHDDWRHVATAIERLSPKLRDAFVLRYVEELSYDEIAAVLNQPLGTVKANAHRGLHAVRTHLEYFASETAR